ESWQRGIRERKERQYGKRPGGAVRLQHAPQLIHLPSLAGGGLWRGCRNMSCPEMLETAGNASKATAEVACGCELRFDRLSRAVGSGEGAGSVGRATNAVGYEDLRVLSVWG